MGEGSTEIERGIGKQRQRQKERERDRQADRHTYRKIDRQA